MLETYKRNQINNIYRYTITIRDQLLFFLGYINI